MIDFYFCKLLNFAGNGETRTRNIRCDRPDLGVDREVLISLVRYYCHKHFGKHIQPPHMLASADLFPYFT